MKDVPKTVIADGDALAHYLRSACDAVQGVVLEAFPPFVRAVRTLQDIAHQIVIQREVLYE
ncbi:hypothetical protein D3C76_1775550 [compost metagenome]